MSNHQSVSQFRWFGLENTVPGSGLWCLVLSQLGTPGGDILCGQEPGHGCDHEPEFNYQGLFTRYRYMIWIARSSNESMKGVKVVNRVLFPTVCMTSHAFIHQPQKIVHMVTDNHSYGWREFILELVFGRFLITFETLDNTTNYSKALALPYIHSLH